MTAKGSRAAGKVSGIIITSQEREVSLHTLILLKVFWGSLNQNKDSKQDSSQQLQTLTPKKCKQMNEIHAAHLQHGWIEMQDKSESLTGLQMKTLKSSLHNHEDKEL